MSREIGRGVFKFFLKEASLLVAFIVLGALLLLSVWIANTVHSSILSDFKNTQISVVLHAGSESRLKDLVDRDPNILRYEVFTADKNKAKLGNAYPELKNVIAPLEDRFFPTSVLVTVNDATAFMAKLKMNTDIAETQILHRPPNHIRQFINVITAVFSGLWLLTLALVLYFNLERLTVKEEPRWSLLKMLGAKPSLLFLPLWYGQLVRILLGSVFAFLLFKMAAGELSTSIIWRWESLPKSALASFFIVSFGVTSLFSLLLFYTRYRRVSIG